MTKKDYFIIDTETHPIDGAIWHQLNKKKRKINKQKKGGAHASTNANTEE